MLFTHFRNVLVIFLLYGSSVLVHSAEQGHSSGVDEPPAKKPRLDSIVGISATHLAPEAEANKEGTSPFLILFWYFKNSQRRHRQPQVTRNPPRQTLNYVDQAP